MASGIERVAERLYATVMAPLVQGGALRPEAPVGARAALALLAAPPRPADEELRSRVDVARVRAARRIAPIDTLDDPDGAEWALAAALHDLVQAASPRWVRRAGARRLLELVSLVVGRVPRARTAREALARHTWFARALTATRLDTHVSWWSGSRTFYGEEPPARLLAWPDLRQVEVRRAKIALTELASRGRFPEHRGLFEDALARFLRATPLTDLATVARATPAFAWSAETLGLARAPVGRTLALRVLARAPMDGADAALGRATRALLGAAAWPAATVAIELLAHRALAAAVTGGTATLAGEEDAASFARAAGALVARKWLDDRTVPLADGDRRRLAPILDAAARSKAALEIAALVERVPSPPPPLP